MWHKMNDILIIQGTNLPTLMRIHDKKQKKSVPHVHWKGSPLHSQPRIIILKQGLEYPLLLCWNFSIKLRCVAKATLFDSLTTYYYDVLYCTVLWSLLPSIRTWKVNKIRKDIENWGVWGSNKTKNNKS